MAKQEEDPEAGGKLTAHLDVVPQSGALKMRGRGRGKASRGAGGHGGCPEGRQGKMLARTVLRLGRLFGDQAKHEDLNAQLRRSRDVSQHLQKLEARVYGTSQQPHDAREETSCQGQEESLLEQSRSLTTSLEAGLPGWNGRAPPQLFAPLHQAAVATFLESKRPTEAQAMAMR